MENNVNRSSRSKELGISRSSLYYNPLQPPKDWKLKCQIEEVLREHPSYGYRRVSLALKRNHKPVQRVMQSYGIKAYRRRGRKPKKKAMKGGVDYSNLLLFTYPECPNHIWVSDFTYLWFKSQWIYVATAMDLFTRVITGYSVLTNHSVQLVMNALLSGLHHHSRPSILHSDHGSEYTSRISLILWRVSKPRYQCQQRDVHGRMAIRRASMTSLRLI